MTKTINTRIKNRLDTFDNWSGANAELLPGEIAFVKATEQKLNTVTGNIVDTPATLMKVGDTGANGEPKTFKELPWVSAKAADVYDWAKQPKKPDYTLEELGIGGLPAELDSVRSQISDLFNNIKIQTVEDSGILDLNDSTYRTQGIYYFNSNTSPTNRPEDVSNGWLLVLDDGDAKSTQSCKQIWCSFGANSSHYRTYVRIHSSDGWSDWVRFATEKDINNVQSTLSTIKSKISVLDDAKSNIQTQLDDKAASNHNHSAANITSDTLSSARLPTIPVTKGGTGATTAAAALTNLGVTATASELNKLDGVTSNIQEQLDSLFDITKTKIVKEDKPDLNTYTTQGIYYFYKPTTTGGVITNAPTSSVKNGWLIVLTGQGTKQIWYRFGTTNSNDYNTWVRTLISGTWSDWVKFATDKDITGLEKNDLCYRGTLNRNHNLNDYKDNGIYLYSTASIPGNCPFSNAGIVEVIKSGEKVLQRVTRYGTGGETAFRTFWINNELETWNAWAKVATDNDIPKHNNYYKYVYVDNTTTQTTCDGSAGKPFKTLDQAFDLLNKGCVDLRIKFTAPGIYEFTRPIFTGIVLHLESDLKKEYKDRGETNVTIKRVMADPPSGLTDSGYTAFYQCHVNARGISWESAMNKDKDTYWDFYFEGGTTTLQQLDGVEDRLHIYPCIKAYGGFLTVGKTDCNCIYLRHCTSVLNNVTVNITEEASHVITNRSSKRVIEAYMSTVHFRTNLTINCEEVTNPEGLEWLKTLKAINITHSKLHFDEGLVIAFPTDTSNNLDKLGKGSLEENIIFSTEDEKKQLLKLAKDKSNLWVNVT